MAVKKPLVISSAGKPEQLQPGDTLGLVSESDELSQTADSALLAGMAVYQSAADHVDKAKADAGATVPCIGLAQAAIGNGATGIIQFHGIISLTTAQWDAVCGTTGGLAFGVSYFLSDATAGMLTSVPPTTVGRYLQEVIRAVSTTEAEILDRDEILL